MKAPENNEKVDSKSSGVQKKEPFECQTRPPNWDFQWDGTFEPNDLNTKKMRLHPVLAVLLAGLVVAYIWSVWPEDKWMQSGRTEAQTMQDETECREQANKDSSLILRYSDKYGSSFRKCMESRGYRLPK